MFLIRSSIVFIFLWLSCPDLSSCSELKAKAAAKAFEKTDRQGKCERIKSAY